jgi:flagellar motility protein MotE (MotC chaperone)
VVQQLEADEEIQNYAQAYAEMKPKEAAGIFEEMTDDLELAAKILNQMSAEDRGKILGVMDPEVAARLTKIMDPDS